MNQTAAVATQNGFPPRDGSLRRLTVHTDSVRADLVLPASVPLECLVPAIVGIVCGHRRGQVAVHYQLSVPGDVALDASKTLAQLRIPDGACLMLTSASMKLTAPRFHDAAHAVRESLAGTERRWTPRLRRLVAALAAGWLSVVCAAVLVHAGLHDGRADDIVVVVVATIALTGLLAAGTAYRVSGNRPAALTLGLVGCGFAAVAAIVAIPTGIGAPHALFATAAVAASASAMRVTGRHPVVFTALACFAATGVVAALVSASTDVSLPAVGAAAAAVSLLALEGSAALSLRLTGLSSDDDVHACDADGLKDKAMCAKDWLVSMTAALSGSAVLGAIAAAARPPGIAFAALTGIVLLSRARAHRDVAMSLPLLGCGTLAVTAALVAAAADFPRRSGYAATTSIGLAAVALCLGSVNLSATLSPAGLRGLEILERVAMVAVLPLACWIGGLYAAARGVNLS